MAANSAPARTRRESYSRAANSTPPGPITSAPASWAASSVSFITKDKNGLAAVPFPVEAQQTCRPSPVPRLNRGGDHQSSPAVADRAKRPTRGHRAGRPNARPKASKPSYLALLRAGFGRPPAHAAAGGLLPHHFT